MPSRLFLFPYWIKFDRSNVAVADKLLFLSRCTLYSIFLLNYLDLCNFHRLMIPNIYTHVAEIICYIRYYFVFFSVCFFLNCVIYKWFLHFKWMHNDINDRVTYQIDIINIPWFICFWWIFVQKRAILGTQKKMSIE